MKIHLIDGNYELFRGFYGPPPKQTSGGREVGTTVSLLRSDVPLAESVADLAWCGARSALREICAGLGLRRSRTASAAGLKREKRGVSKRCAIRSYRTASHPPGVGITA